MVTFKSITAARAEIIGGDDITSIRPHFDTDDRNIIALSTRGVQYHSTDTGEPSGRAYIDSIKLKETEVIIDAERLDSSLLVFTNYGKIFVWNLSDRCWLNEMSLPIKKGESLVSCKMLSKRQYIYTVLDNENNECSINYSMSRSERERPKSRETIGKCSEGSSPSFDILTVVNQSKPTEIGSPGKSGEPRKLVYIENTKAHFVQAAINEKLSGNRYHRQNKINLTCIKASKVKAMVAVGDMDGRIHLYQGDFHEGDLNRTRLHWHTMPVTDICYSSTGNTMYSVGGESGCIVVWDLGKNNLGQKRVIARLGLPIRYINCSNNINQIVVAFEDNELGLIGSDEKLKRIHTLTRRTNLMFEKNDHKALRAPFPKANDATSESRQLRSDSIGILWHSSSDTIMTNSQNGNVQFYDPHSRKKESNLNITSAKMLSLERELAIKVSDITRAALSLDGNWLACLETRSNGDYFPEVKLHIWRIHGSRLLGCWNWIQTVDRLHDSADVVDLKFSPDGKFLISLCKDGSFHIFHRLSLDLKRQVEGGQQIDKQMYVKGFSGSASAGIPVKAAFSNDSSVLAISLMNDTVIIWSIQDPYKIVYECQLNEIADIENEPDQANNNVDQSPFLVLGLHFGIHKESEKMAPLCEIRSKGIKIWNVLNPQNTCSYSIDDAPRLTNPTDGNRLQSKFTTACFDLCPAPTGEVPINFAVCTQENLIMFFRLELKKTMEPLFCVDGSPTFGRSVSPTYTSMCFVQKPISDLDPECYHDKSATTLLARLCLLNDYHELVGFTDQLTLQRRLAINTCNDMKSLDMSELRDYLIKGHESYNEEARRFSRSAGAIDFPDPSTMTEKQRRIRCRLDVQKMLKDMIARIPSQNLPDMDTLGPIILDKLIIK